MSNENHIDRCPRCDGLVNRYVNGERCPFCGDKTFPTAGARVVLGP